MPDAMTFTPDGALPPGDYPLTFDELRSSILVVGPKKYPTWNAGWRLQLVENLEILVKQLWAVGIDEIFIDGSFVEDKDHPNDIDGYFVCDPQRFVSHQLEDELNRLDPEKCWTWNPISRRPFKGYPKRQLPMWHSYRVELYPHYSGAIAGFDEHGNALEFPAFFRKSRSTKQPKGIVRIIR
ncbi:MAG TPA: hypothetical protein VFE47_18565 [Tepidisphaeraceae bacterium]|jgi:hypothetical protein|nr:hypothetical protein [Tepidisphaeraceae bacterium]